MTEKKSPIDGTTSQQDSVHQNRASKAPHPPQPDETFDKTVHRGNRQHVWWLRSVINSALFLTTGLLLIVAVGFAQRQGWMTAGRGVHSSQKNAVAAQSYVCPMMCTPNRFPEPGRCPVCAMETAPVQTTSANGDEFSVVIEPAARRIANIETATVKAMYLEQDIRTIGSLALDESRLSTISAYVDGRLERLFADFRGVQVVTGDPMVLMYSPDLYSAQTEFLIIRKLGGTNFDAQQTLVKNSREKLSELGMTEEQIGALEKEGQAQTRLKICAPIGGTVIEKLCREGDYVKTGDPIYRIADLSVVWLMLKLFPEDASRVRYAQCVEAEVQSLPGEFFSGRVAFIDPVVDEKTRTVSVRVELFNTNGRLRPGDYATATVKIPIAPDGKVFDRELAGKWISPRYPQVIQDNPGRCPLSDCELVPTSQFGYETKPVTHKKATVVPRDAVLLAGSRSVVYVEVEPGRFEIRPVTLGRLTEKWAAIFGGIDVGEKVATSGNFLIDSQMQLAGNPSLIDPTRAIQRQQQPLSKPGPLDVAVGQQNRLSGEPGSRLDELYAAYFSIQKVLAADKAPTKAQIAALRSAEKRLRTASGFAKELNELLKPIAKNTVALDKKSVKDARKIFKPISHAIVRLASKCVGAKQKKPLIHFYCPMVKGGGGDWLQADELLANPYFGSQMLRCGQKVHEFSAESRTAQRESTDKNKKTTQQ